MARDAMRRLCKDLEQLERSNNPQLTVRPSEGSMLEWHFAVHHLPDDSVYVGGCYHGKILFPEKYPLSPPSLVMLTPSGRFEVNKRLCLSMTDFHPESWNPAWTVESILVGLISFMVDERETNSIGAMLEPPEVRRRLAARSAEFNRSGPEFCALFPELVGQAAQHPHQPLSAGLGGAGAREDDADGTDTAAAAAPQAAPDANAAARPDADLEGGVAASAGAAVEERPGVPAVGAEARRETEVTEEAEECWICRQDASVEPIIQPCACRGSMSGVHASCVEAWIAHHRANATNDEVPKCTVCNQPYSGTERRPGALLYARHLCRDVARSLSRSLLLVLNLVGYWGAAQENFLSLWLRVVLFAAVWPTLLYKSLVLTVSLPRGRLAPDGCLRHLFTADPRLIAIHITELSAIEAICSMWCIFGQLKLPYFLPLPILVIMPMCAALLKSGLPRTSRAVAMAVAVISSPVVLMVQFGRLMMENPRAIADPTRPPLHLLVPLAVLPMVFLTKSAAPVVYVVGGHSAVLAISVAEKLLVGRVHWAEGRLWWLLLQLVLLASYVANLIYNFSADFAQSGDPLKVLLSTAAWSILTISLTLAVNWRLCVNQFHAWQARNGSFELRANADAPATAEGTAPGRPTAVVPARGAAGVEVLAEPEVIGASQAREAAEQGEGSGQDEQV